MSFSLVGDVLTIMLKDAGGKNMYTTERAVMSLCLIKHVLKDGDILEFVCSEQADPINIRCEPLVAHELFHIFPPEMRASYD